MTQTIIDTFQTFQNYWMEYSSQPLGRQIDGWETDYMAQWPELFRKQIDDYKSDGFEWREIAREQVFPELGRRMSDIQVAYGNLQEVLTPTLTKATEVLDFTGEIVSVIYVGIGLGAGWATKYGGKPAVLYGLENIAECGWIRKVALMGLIAHEVGHVVHFARREVAGIPMGTGPWWQLYSEGVAMRSENLVMGTESWHMREREGGGDWLDWCRTNRALLAAEFLKTADSEDSIRPFFGSWFDFRGYRQTGYFLGHELVQLLEEDLSLDEIALLNNNDPRLRDGLAKLANRASI
jgi:hypothetical protein